ncbi:MID1 [Branchiostoma lanceolatum]|uniref:MID1 protein n=1 Tax=Branchiostoma lanceolatum TaxID=7740 RepID=A0A8K0ES42_BRALA|nr:MID1 [Branchiostoma lanceolatum]
MEALESELTCPVCLDLFEDPLQLPCQHNLCRRCFDNICRALNKPGDGAEAVAEPDKESETPASPFQPSDHDVTEEPFQCPTCREEVDLGSDGAAATPRRNLLLQNIVERYRKAAGRGEGEVLPCQICDDESPSPAVKLCVQCNLKYCESCLSSCHPKKGALARHQLVEPTAEKKTVMCSEHDDEKINLVCIACEVPICQLCKLVGKHKEHDVDALSTQYNVKKEHLAGNVLKLKSWMSSLETFINDLDDMKQQVKEGGEQMREKVKAAVDELFTILQERRDAMLEKSRDIEKEKMDKIDQEETKRKDEVKTCKAVTSYADEVAKETDQACFLQAVKATNDRVTKTSPTEDVLQLPCDANFPAPTFSSVVKLLRKLSLSPSTAEGKIKFQEHKVEGDSIVLHWEDESKSPEPGVQYELQWQKEGDGDKWFKIPDISQLSYSLKPPEGSYVMVFRVRCFFMVFSYNVISPWSESLRLKIVGIQMTTDSCDISASSGAALALLDGREDTYWFAYEHSKPQQWIRLDIKEGMSSMKSLAMKLIPNPRGDWRSSFRPHYVAVYGGDSFQGLTLLSEVDIGDKDDHVTLLENLDKVYRCFEIKVGQVTMSVPAYMVCQLQVQARGITVTKISQ